MASQDTRFPLGGGWSTKNSATATCYCGAVQLSFPPEWPKLLSTFTCYCTDCRKITASMFATNFVVPAERVKHVRGEEKLTRFAQSATIKSGKEMANHFCSVCGLLMYQISAAVPNALVLRTGAVDDFALHESKLRPRAEIFCDGRVGLLKPGEGAKEVSTDKMMKANFS